jgi:hypothetical protein
MNKYPLIGVSICAVVLLILGSLSNVVGVQTVQSSNQNTINNEVNQRELLFQTIVDITNNKEIQRIILKSQMMNGKFFGLDAKLQTSITKQQLRQMYFIGLILSKVISKAKIQSMIQQYQLINPELQQEISAVIEKDATLNAEITQLSNSECDCENDETTGLWKFPVICTALYFLVMFFMILWVLNVGIAEVIGEFLGQIAYDMDCFWTPYKGVNQ